MVDPETVRSRLGGSAKLWQKAIDQVRARVPEASEAWHFAGAKFGWSLRVLDRERVLVYLTPGDGGFRVGFVLGKKGVAAAREAGLSAAALALLDAAPVYAEGLGVRFEVRAAADLAPFAELLAIKTAGPRRRRAAP